jgi:hypothetical protein
VADLRPTRGRGTDRDDTTWRTRERAQLILIAGFALAVTLIALALVMNAAIYTENLATRSESAGISDAHAFQRATQQAAREAWTYAHEVNNGSYAELDENVTAAMEGYNNVTSRQEVRTGRITNVSVETTAGTNITSADSGDFTDADGDTEWTLAQGVSRTRNFTMRVEDTSVLADVGAGTDEFRVVARGSTERWYLNVSYDSTAGETVVGVNASGDYDTCTTTGPSFEINFSAGTVAGSDCPALDMSETPDTYDLEFRNASAVEGQYSLIVDTDASNRGSYDASPPSRPRAQPVIYSMTVELVYRTTDLRYETDIRIAPGEEDV